MYEPVKRAICAVICGGLSAPASAGPADAVTSEELNQRLAIA